MDEARMRGLVARFLGQVEETAPRIARGVVDLERVAGNPEGLRNGLDAIARDLHGIKGTAAMLALGEVAELAHATEEVVRWHRAEGRSWSPAVADRMLEASDTFVALVRSKVHDEPPPSVDGLMAALARAGHDDAPVETAVPASDS